MFFGSGGGSSKKSSAPAQEPPPVIPPFPGQEEPKKRKKKKGTSKASPADDVFGPISEKKSKTMRRKKRDPDPASSPPPSEPEPPKESAPAPAAPREPKGNRRRERRPRSPSPEPPAQAPEETHAEPEPEATEEDAPAEETPEAAVPGPQFTFAGPLTDDGLVGDLRALLHEGLFADVEFAASDEAPHRAHRAILAARLPLFRADEAAVRGILEGYTATQANVLLEYCYTDELVTQQFALSQSVPLLQLAARLELPRLAALLEHHVVQHANMNNVIPIVNEAERLGVECVQQFAISYISQPDNRSTIIQSLDKLSSELNKELLKAFVEVREYTPTAVPPSTYRQDLRVLLADAGDLHSDFRVSVEAVSCPDDRLETTCAMPCHRCILAARSRFFRDLLTRDDPPEAHADHTGAVPSALRVLLTFLYTGEVDALRLPEAVSLCAQEPEEDSCPPTVSYGLTSARLTRSAQQLVHGKQIPAEDVVPLLVAFQTLADKRVVPGTTPAETALSELRRVALAAVVRSKASLIAPDTLSHLSEALKDMILTAFLTA